MLHPSASAAAIDSLLAPYAGQVRVRVGGLLLRGGSLLLAAHRGLLPAEAPFWSPPGGGWTFGESLKAALVREFQEETGLAVRVGRFLHLHEFQRDGLQALELLKLGQSGAALGYVLASVAMCIVGCWLGFLAGSAMAG